MQRGPLQHPKLVAVERRLDDCALDEAQHLLAQLGEVAIFRPAVAYLTTRLRYLRGQLEQDQVVERLRTLLGETPEFPEARAMLEAAEAGLLTRDPTGPSSRPPPSSRPAGPDPNQARLRPEVELGYVSSGSSTPPNDSLDLMMPNIPRAARAPRLTPPEQRRAAGEPGRPPSIPELDVGSTRPPPGFELEPGVPGAPLPDLGPLRVLSPPPGVEPRAEGRYTATVAEDESVQPIRATPRRTPAERASSRPSPARRASSRPPRASDGPDLIRSGIPPAASLPSLFEIAALLDAGRPDAALVALERLGSGQEPDQLLMRARILARLGHREDAEQSLVRLGQAPLLEPEVRAGAARLALELDHVGLAFELARRAHDDDPTQPMVRLSLAWAALRQARRRWQPELVRTAERALEDLPEALGPHPGLVLALRACVEAHVGGAERAIELAERALAQEPSADAWVALALGAARDKRPTEVKRAWSELSRLSPAEAHALELSLERLGAHGGQSAPDADAPIAPAPRHDWVESARTDPRVAQLWEPLELLLADGSRREALTGFEQLARARLDHVLGEASREAPAVAAVAASFFTTAPISRDFAPYDASLGSLKRLEGLLRVLGSDPDAEHAATSDALVLLAGAYLGESLRLAAGMTWHGTPADGPRAKMSGAAGDLFPIGMVRDQLWGRAPLSASALLALAPRAVAWTARQQAPVVPPCPWDPAPWPAPQGIALYGRGLGRSVVAAWCTRATGRTLDGSIESLTALDAYLALLLPEEAPRAQAPDNARRVSVLVGSYLGEVLRAAAGGQWWGGDQPELGPDSYRLALGRTVMAAPIAEVWKHFTVRATSLTDYAVALVREARS